MNISWTNAVCWLVHSSAASGLRGRVSTRLEGHFSGGHPVSDEEGQGEQNTHTEQTHTHALDTQYIQYRIFIDFHVIVSWPEESGEAVEISPV